MEQIGYSLINRNGDEISYWGDTPGQMVSAPAMILLPNGNQVHCPAIGVEYSGCRLVPRMHVEGDESSVSCAGRLVVVTRPKPHQAELQPEQFITKQQMKAVLLKIGISKSEVENILRDAEMVE